MTINSTTVNYHTGITVLVGKLYNNNIHQKFCIILLNPNIMSPNKDIQYHSNYNYSSVATRSTIATLTHPKIERKWREGRSSIFIMVIVINDMLII